MIIFLFIGIAMLWVLLNCLYQYGYQGVGVIHHWVDGKHYVVNDLAMLKFTVIADPFLPPGDAYLVAQFSKDITTEDWLLRHSRIGHFGPSSFIKITGLT